MSTYLECQLRSAQLMTDGVSFRDLTRLVELFVVRAQMMADKIVSENNYDVLSVRDEF